MILIVLSVKILAVEDGFCNERTLRGALCIIFILPMIVLMGSRWHYDGKRS